MADFNDLLDDDVLMDTLGDDVTFIKSGGLPVAIKVFMHFDVERVGAEGYTVEHRTEVEVLKTDVPNICRADRFIHRGTTYEVDGIESDDGVYVRCSVREAA